MYISEIFFLCVVIFSKKMRVRIEQNLLKALFFRPNLITSIKVFLPNIISIENIPRFFQNNVFFNYLAKNSIKIENNEEKEDDDEEEETEEEMHFKQIIEKDDLELLQQEFENDKNIILRDSFFEEDEMKIPILHYCVMKKAIKCFKFLLLNGVDPSQTLSKKKFFEHNEYEWDCISIAVCFGEWEMMKILEERGINKLNNPNVWQAAALTHRNKLLKLLISNKDQIDNFEECLKKGLLGAIKGNNFKGIIILISKGADINAKDIISQIMKNHF